jgi:3-hydroxyacyl-[acyl-carrier-protein] dehydratase
VDPELRPKLRGSNLELRLVEDLALDSLTLMEIIILVEEVLIVSISNEAARALRTVEDVRAFAEANC